MQNKKVIIFVVAITMANIIFVTLLQALFMGFLKLGFSNTLFIYTISYFLIGLLTTNYSNSFSFRSFFIGLLSGFLLINLMSIYSLPLHRILLFDLAQFSGLLAFSIGFNFRVFKQKVLPITLFLGLLALNLLLKKIIYPHINYNLGYNNEINYKKLPYHLTVYDTANNEVSLEKFRNKVVYIDFWTSNCKPCILKLPFIDSLAMVYQNNPNVEIVSLFSGSGDTMLKLKEIMKKKSIKHTIFFDRDGIITKYCDIQGVPTEIIFNKKGNSLRKYEGFGTDTYFLQRTNEELQKIFNENTYQ
jgi:thiol-disulfide isomerase/thioredoxin